MQPFASPPPSGGGDGELVGLLAASSRGDEKAFARLYDLTSARVYGLVRRVVRDPAQSEEVAQEVYLEVWRQSARFDPARGSAAGWILTVAHRRAVDRVRSAESAQERDRRYAAVGEGPAYDVVEETVTARLDSVRVRRALETLTDVQREALTLAYFGGYTHREVSDLLGVPLGTVKTRMRDGLIRLRDTLGVES
ncbi:MAG TPA: ECF RNA polymerase sigma factor SigK [Candidatus Nanopelagicales bacterium]|nr:ECF RNA polymerase sigma factor SigK [Candidatus Nanopelagicales bacterium]